MYDFTHTKYNIRAASQDASSLHGSCKGVLSYSNHTNNPRYLGFGMSTKSCNFQPAT